MAFESQTSAPGTRSLTDGEFRESQHTLEALFIFGLGNWVVLIINVSCCKQAEKGQEEGRLEGLVDQSRLWQATKIFYALIRYGKVGVLL